MRTEYSINLRIKELQVLKKVAMKFDEREEFIKYHQQEIALKWVLDN